MLDDTQLINKVYVHHSGREYKLVYVANTLSEDLIKFPILAVYESILDRVIWSRPLEDFKKNFKLKSN